MVRLQGFSIHAQDFLKTLFFLEECNVHQFTLMIIHSLFNTINIQTFQSPKDSYDVEISEHSQLKVHRVRRPPSDILRETQSGKTDSAFAAAVKKVPETYFDKINWAMQQLNAAKNVKRRRGGRNKENDVKR